MKKRFLSVLLAAVLCLCLLPTAAFAASDLQSRVNEAAKTTGAECIILQSNVKLDRALTVPAGEPVTIDLNGYTIDRGLKTAKANGNVITVYGDLTILDRSGKGAVTGGNTSGAGGGIIVMSGGKVTMSGANVVGNKAKGAGGGVYIQVGGKLLMNGGSISSNETKDCGGGVFACDAFIMNGGELSYNTASQRGGGIYIFGDKAASGANATPSKWVQISGGTVAHNTAGANGGGIYVHYYDLDLDMNHTLVTLNYAGSIGGGIYANRTLKLGVGNSVAANSAKVSLTANIYAPDQVKSNEGTAVDMLASAAVKLANKLFGR